MQTSTNTVQLPITSARNPALDLFEHLAASTWDFLDHSRRLCLGFSEDTISDLATMAIARNGSTGVAVKRVTKRQEGIVGFDWMWLVHRPTVPPKCYVVQAKKLHLEPSQKYRYQSLKRRAAAGRYQIDALKDFATWLGATPLYCFYNHVDDQTARRYWHCRQRLPLDVAQMGCTLVPLEHVRLIHENRRFPKNFYTIHQDPNAVPWRCLFHPNCAGFSQPGMSEPRGTASLDGMRTLNRLVELVSVADETLDVDSLISALDLEDIVTRYATDAFTPIPGTIISIRLAG